VFLEYFGLKEQPFGVTPDPRFLYLGDKHREALASLVYGTETDRGFLALIAKPGMGKTSLLVQYLEHYADKARTCPLYQPNCSASELLRRVLRALGFDSGKKDVPEMRDLLNQVLLEEMAAGRRFLLVIDEAQNLSDAVLESVRLLSNFETPTKKLMHIVLAGQPQLAERLAKPSLTQLRQRISAVIRLNPFSNDETCVYIEHRLRVAGYQGAPLFTDSARTLIAQHSEGIPRNINNLCFNAMSLAFATDAKQIDLKAVREVISDLEIESLGSAKAPVTRSVPPVKTVPSRGARTRVLAQPSYSEEKQYAPEPAAARPMLPPVLPAAAAAESVPKFYVAPSVSFFPRRHAMLLTILAAAVLAAAMTSVWIRISAPWINVRASSVQMPLENQADAKSARSLPRPARQTGRTVRSHARADLASSRDPKQRVRVQPAQRPTSFAQAIGMDQAQEPRFIVELLQLLR